MTRRERTTRIAFAVAVTLAGGCSGAAGGSGTASFTTWGEAYIMDGIPADPSGEHGFVDGWTLTYDKFLVTFHAIVVADDRGETAATMTGSRLVDNHQQGRKELVSFPDVPARAWNRVSYQIKPARADTELVSATEADRDLMVAGGYALYASGTATKPDETSGQSIIKTFHWGFPTATQYRECQQAADSGLAIEGIVVPAGGADVSELTTHGDHLFYDRLMASDDPAVKTSLRFDEKAAADTDGDGEITLAELAATPIDVRKYDPSGLPATNLGTFITALARTVGHFRGEGECAIAKAE
jgi:hypothetical protein